MQDTPQVLEFTAQQTAVIRLTVSPEEMRQVVGPALMELFTSLAMQGIEPVGAWFTHHLHMDAACLEFEIGVPVATAVTAEGRVQPGELPAARIARRVYQGGYEGLAAAWEEFDGWVASQGLKPASQLWECYVAGPEVNPDPATWRTELNRPLLS